MLDDPSLEGQRPLLDTTRTVAHIFKSQGYKTGMVGKWGLGAPNTNSIPNKMGFDFFCFHDIDFVDEAPSLAETE